MKSTSLEHFDFLTLVSQEPALNQRQRRHLHQLLHLSLRTAPPQAGTATVRRAQRLMGMAGVVPKAVQVMRRWRSPLIKISLQNIANPSCCDDWQRLQCYQGGGEWYESQCACYSPVVIDVAGNGFNLTNAVNGVMFDLPGAGVAERLSWTSVNSDDAWLTLDRNGNGIIDNGKELYGTFTAQPALASGESKNGFRALAMFDSPAFGGNADGQIDSRDAAFPNLRLWQDRNHNGLSEADELRSFSGSDVAVIQLSYKESRRKDANGNWFRYRAKVMDVNGAQAGRWAWDVFLQKP